MRLIIHSGCNGAMEVNVVCKNKHLIDIGSFKYITEDQVAVAADFNHLPDQRTDDEERAAVHGTHWIVDDYDFSLVNIILVSTALNCVEEVEKCYEVPFAFTEILGELSGRIADHFIA